MEWLKQIAPTVASALLGPLAGMAVAAVSKALSIDPETVSGVIQSGKLDADQVAGLQMAEMELKLQAQKMGLDFEALAVQDRGSARNMQMVTSSIIPPFLAITVTLGFFGILTLIGLDYIVSPADSAPLMIMLGSLGTAWTGIIAFYFGSSSSSQSKDKLLFHSAPSK